jgi:hypothetical protein
VSTAPVLSSLLKHLLSPRGLRIFTWVWIFCVIAGSLLPWSLKNRLGTTIPDRLNGQVAVSGWAHRVWHVSVFGFTALLLLIQSSSERQKLHSLMAAFGLGLILEFLEFFFYGNVFEWWDVRDDAYGVMAAFGLVWLIARRRIRT